MPPKRPSAPNPVEYTYAQPTNSSVSHSIASPPAISSTTFHIAGILTHVHGLAELPSSCTEVAVLWLLHPRLQDHRCMAPFAAHIITNYYAHLKTGAGGRGTGGKETGLIAVSFDQRNHGTRLVDKLANEAWRSGNEHHAQDMFSCFAGTAEDTSLLLNYLAAYAFPEGKVRIARNMVMGISLGGHAAWHLVMRDERFSAAIVVIGCPDYTRLMVDRARLSKRACWLEGQGKGFLGSKDWPQGLVEAIDRVDPASYFSKVLGRGAAPGEEDWARTMSEEEVRRVRPEMERCFGGKRLLILSGGADKLVNYKFSEPFLTWLKSATAKGGWFDDGGLHLKDVVAEGYGHEVPPSMVEEMLPFINETMDEADGRQRRRSKI
ncbi:uncharacterized protein HMPREF1541_09293 [Cyphellophora europaea CBS 101466]|uniref:AB hydrolase-1 domain-containing protein n=1 Tax=Cyphellophora europaea (strain CBS 101466) TaxID=1220924 RepID=W2S9R3_CYPE1|nr:uncharacterized protein HMPREF1541_09293 [Cyphellophora europaea CBS 101466]ETN45461.1 hypothetical protein HMPREF1541_09293 [Cyphellophora europaea CBS 101466]